VPEVERKRRVRALIELDAELGAAVRASFLGDVRPVLWENRDTNASLKNLSEDFFASHPEPVEGWLASHTPSASSGQALRQAQGAQAMVGAGSELSLGPNARQVWSGLTDNYLRVLAAAPAELDLHNRITPVRLDRLDDDALWGSMTTA
jgi:hypothetical protein